MVGIVGEHDVVGAAVEVEVGLLVTVDAGFCDHDGAFDGILEDSGGPKRVLKIDADVFGHDELLYLADLDAQELADHFFTSMS